MKQVYKSGNYVIAVDANGNQREFPVGKCIYTEDDTRFKIIEGVIEDSQIIIPKSDVTNWTNESAEAYTEATMRTFLRENTGFNSGTGGSVPSTSTTIDSWVYSNEDYIGSTNSLNLKTTATGTSLMSNATLNLKTADSEIITQNFSDTGHAIVPTEGTIYKISTTFDLDIDVNDNTVEFALGTDVPASTPTSVSGITLEGTAINQTGTNLFNDPAVDADGIVWGWLSIDEQLSAGQRLVLDNAFMVDLTDAMPDNSGIFIGLKSGSWSNNLRNNSIANATYAGARFAIYKYSVSDIRVFGHITGAATIGKNFGLNWISTKGLELAFEITSSGNNIRLMMRNTDDNSTDNASSTTYENWHSNYKTQTGDQGFGITSLDMMILGDANVNATGASGAMDSADVDWTGLTQINTPIPYVLIEKGTIDTLQNINTRHSIHFTPFVATASMVQEGIFLFFESVTSGSSNVGVYNINLIIEETGQNNTN